MAERKTVLAVPIFELFRARFKVEMISSRPVGRWGTVSMVETVGSCKSAVRCRVLGGGPDVLIIDVRSFVTVRSVQVDGFCEEECIRNCSNRRHQWEISAGFEYHREVVKFTYEAQGSERVLRSMEYGAKTSMFLRVSQCRCRTEIANNP